MNVVPEIPYLSRRDLYQHLGLISLMEPMTEDLMRERAERSYVEDEFDSPHKRAWNVSFHASSFPGDESEACARKLVYRMMNIPSATGAMDPWITSTGALGKAGELDIVDAWFEGGRMLGIPEDPLHPDRHQLGFVDPEHWLTGSTDLAILPPFSTRPHIVEIKSGAQEKIDEMIDGRQMMRDGQMVLEPRGPDAAHVRQLKATVGLAHEYDWGWAVVCEHCWAITSCEIFERLGLPDGMHPRSDAFNYCWRCKDYESRQIQLESPTTGEIFYWGRSWPRGNPRLGMPRTKSFFFEHDPAYMARGREVLRGAVDHFKAGNLPPRGLHMQWSVPPCQWCDYKPVCRLDEGLQPRKRKATSEPVKTLAESNAVAHALSVRPHYDLDAVREQVFAEWREPDGGGSS